MIKIKKDSIRKVGRIATPIVLVIAVAASLFLAAPLPAKAVNITVTNNAGGPVLPEAYLNEEHESVVIVDVQNMDVLPVRRVDVRIINVADPTKTATLENLPLHDVAKQAHALAEGSASGSAAVKVVACTYWGYGYTTRTGYGYGYTGYGYGYVNITGSTLGYGYGYGDGSGYGSGSGYGFGDGSGYGFGSGYGSGDGSGYGDGDGSGSGY